MSQLLRPIARIDEALAQTTWTGLWPRLAVAALNFTIALVGTTSFFATIGPDPDAPWVAEMRLFLLLTIGPALGGLLLLLLASALLGLRGWPEFIVPISILGLGLPFAQGYATWWYMRNVADATISGPAAAGLAMLATMILVFGAFQVLIGMVFLAYRVRTGLSPG